MKIRKLYEGKNKRGLSRAQRKYAREIYQKQKPSADGDQISAKVKEKGAIDTADSFQRMQVKASEKASDDAAKKYNAENDEKAFKSEKKKNAERKELQDKASLEANVQALVDFIGPVKGVWA